MAPMDSTIAEQRNHNSKESIIATTTIVLTNNIVL